MHRALCSTPSAFACISQRVFAAVMTGTTKSWAKCPQCGGCPSSPIAAKRCAVDRCECPCALTADSRPLKKPEALPLLRPSPANWLQDLRVNNFAWRPHQAQCCLIGLTNAGWMPCGASPCSNCPPTLTDGIAHCKGNRMVALYAKKKSYNKIGFAAMKPSCSRFPASVYTYSMVPLGNQNEIFCFHGKTMPPLLRLLLPAAVDPAWALVRALPKRYNRLEVFPATADEGGAARELDSNDMALFSNG